MGKVVGMKHVMLLATRDGFAWLGKVKVMLHPALEDNHLRLWDNMDRPSGENKEMAMRRALHQALSITPFVTSEFLADGKMKEVVEQAQVLELPLRWIAARSALYECSIFKDIACVNDPERPLQSISERDLDQVLLEIARELLKPLPPQPAPKLDALLPVDGEDEAQLYRCMVVYEGNVMGVIEETESRVKTLMQDPNIELIRFEPGSTKLTFQTSLKTYARLKQLHTQDELSSALEHPVLDLYLDPLAALPWPEYQALKLCRYLMEGNLPEPLQRRASRLLASQEGTLEVVRHYLFATGIPEQADLHAAAGMCTGAFAELFQELETLRATINDLCTRFDTLLEDGFPNRLDKEVFRILATHRGWMHQVVKLMADGKNPNLLLFQVRATPRQKRALTHWLNHLGQKAAPQPMQREKPRREEPRRRGRRQRGRRRSAEEQLAAVQSQIELMRDAVRKGHKDQVWKIIGEMEKTQKPEHFCKTLCQVAAIAQEWGDHALQLGLAEKAVATNRNDVVAQTQWAHALLKNNRLEEAQRAYDQSIQMDPANPISRNGQAEVFLAMNRLEDARTAYEATVRDFPADVVTRNGLAQTLLAMNRLTEAHAAYEATVRDFPTDVVARNGLAQTLLAMNRLAEAHSAYAATVRDFPTNVVARNGLAQTLLAMNRLTEAHATYAATVRDFPMNVVARSGLAQTLLAMNRLTEAHAAYAATVRDFPTNAVARTGLAQTLLAMNRLEDAHAAYAATVHDFPTDVVARTGLAQTLLAMNRLTEAHAAYAATVRDFPTNVVARSGLAQTLLAMNRLEEAHATYKTTVNDFSTNVVARNGLAQVLRAMGRLPDARRIYEQTRVDFPQDEVTRNGLALTLAAMGKVSEALAELGQATPLTDSQWIGFHIRAMLHLRQGDLAEAERLLIYGLDHAPPKDQSYFRSASALLRLRQKQLNDAIDILPPTTEEDNEFATVIRFHAFGAARKQAETQMAADRLAQAPGLCPPELQSELRRRFLDGQDGHHDDQWLYEQELNLYLRKAA